MDVSPIPVSMRNDSALASRWFWSLGHGKPDDSGRESNSENQTARISLTAHFFGHRKALLAQNSGSTGLKLRGQTVKAQSDAGLAEVARATSRLWRKQPQNASVLNGGFRLDVVSTRESPGEF
jgi:hypothetical protein